MRSRFGVVVAVVCVMAACTDDGDSTSVRPRRPVSSPTSETTTVIGLVGTMSGRDSWRGTDAFEGAHFGVQALNRNIDPAHPRFELVTLDDRGDPSRATALVTELAANPRTAGVIYAGPTRGLPPAQAALGAAGIPGLLCYGDLYSARLLRSHLFQMSPPFLWQARVIASYTTRDRRYRKVGVLAEQSLDGRTAIAALQDALVAAGGRRAIVQRYSPRDPEPRHALAALEERAVEAVVVQGQPRLFDAVHALLWAKGQEYETTAKARRGPGWTPHLMGFDAAIHEPTSARASLAPDEKTPGIVAADSYSRGVHYLPVPSFEAFRSRFVDWWGEQPLGWEVRAYQAVQMIGWAQLRTDPEGDVAVTLERLRGTRFGGLDITLGPDDHTAVEQTTIGLWTVPRPRARVPERGRLPDSLPWVPLARTFSIDRDRTDVLPQDWEHLFRGQTRRDRPAPKFDRMRFGVTTPRSDPVH